MQRTPWTLAISAALLGMACEQEVQFSEPDADLEGADAQLPDPNACDPSGPERTDDGADEPAVADAGPPAPIVGRPIDPRDTSPPRPGHRRDVHKVDLLFVVDNSGTMREEQETLIRDFPGMVRVLVSGDRDGDGDQDFPPIEDLHVGVTSTEVGIGDFEVDKCMTPTDDGRLLAGNPPAASCPLPASGPPFLTFEAQRSQPDQLTSEFACFAQLGTDGCGFEQQLEATLLALWPSSDSRVLFGDNAFFASVNPAQAFGGQADRANQGFVRPGAGADASLLVVVLITDEDDCSAADLSVFMPPPPEADPLAWEDIDVRCQVHAELLHPVSRYADAFRLLRGGAEPLFLFMAIAGVPADLVSASARAPVDFTDASARDAYYDAILDDDRMQEVILPPLDPGLGSRLRRSCETDTARATPPRRIVQTVQALGEQGALHSLCGDGFGDALDLLIERIGLKVEDTCVAD